MRRVLAAVLFWMAAVAPAATAPLSLDAYVASLEEIRSLLASKQIARAQERARALAAHQVAAPEGAFQADTALLERVAATQRDDLRLQERLATTIGELRRGSDSGPAAADRGLLRRVAEEQRVPELVAGGEVPIQPQSTPLVERIAESLGEIVEWIGEKLGKVIDWLLEFLPRGRGSAPGTVGMRWIVTGLVAVIVLLIVLLAIEVTRRSRPAARPHVQTAAPIGSRRDEDPLSRGAGEWERYAAQLAAAGRFREAIRAWYHAVLVTCYSAGVLHYRKSRTNWEYVSALAPSLPWRGEMIRLTQRFEREWYGSDHSSKEALEDCTQRAREIIDAIRVPGRDAA